MKKFSQYVLLTFAQCVMVATACFAAPTPLQIPRSFEQCVKDEYAKQCWRATQRCIYAINQMRCLASEVNTAMENVGASTDGNIDQVGQNIGDVISGACGLQNNACVEGVITGCTGRGASNADERRQASAVINDYIRERWQCLGYYY